MNMVTTSTVQYSSTRGNPLKGISHLMNMQLGLPLVHTAHCISIRAGYMSATRQAVDTAFSSLLFGVSLLVTAGPGLVQPFAFGPPVDDGFFNQTCDLMTPRHNDLAPTAGTGGYSIETDLSRYGHTGFKYTAGKEYTGTIISIDDHKDCRLDS